MRLAVLSSHPVQYYAPLFRELATRVDMHVFYSHKATPLNQAEAGFGTTFDWDVDLTSGYAHSFLPNQSRRPGTGHFFGCDTPDIGYHLRTGRFEVVLAMGWNLKSYVQGIVAAKRLSLPVLVRGDSQLETPRSKVKNAAKSLLYPGLLRHFDAALYVGKRSRAYYRNFRYPADRLFFSPHCVDNERFSACSTRDEGRRLRAENGISPEAKIVLFAGKLVPFKRPLDLIAAAGICRMRGTNVEVMIAGDGPLASKVMSVAAATGVPLHFLGFCNQTKMPAVYSASDVAVLPSDGRETWGLVANEALACGRPIILSDAVGASPDLVDAETGLTFPVEDIVGFADAITKVLRGSYTPSAMAAKSRAYSPIAAAGGVEAALNALRCKLDV